MFLYIMVSVYRKVASIITKLASPQLNWILVLANNKSADKRAQPDQQINNLVIHSFDILASIGSSTDRVETYLVGNPDYRFHHVEVHLHAREPLYSKGAVIAWWLQSKSAQNSVPSCLQETIHRELLSLINPAMYLLSKLFVGRVNIATVPELCKKMFFFS